MKKILPIFMLLLITVLISVSCKTTPDTKALTAAIEKTDAARQKAIDFESPAYFPSEWEATEAKYEEAGTMPLTSAVEVQEAENTYNKLTESYDEIFQKTAPLYAQAREDEILATRETLINSGFTSYFPDYLENADKLALSAQDEYNKGNYYEAREKASGAMDEYETLLAGANVYMTRQEIMDRGFVQYDADNFSKADAVSKSAVEDFEAGRKESAVAKAEEALLRYNLVLANGWTTYAKERQNLASAEREKAIAERANIASRDNFREAETLYNQAERSVNSKDLREASLHYTDAEAMFAIARKDTAEKRQRAEDAMRRADIRISESAEAAQEADRVISVE